MDTALVRESTPATGLDERAVRERVEAGLVNRAPAGTSRTLRDILRANILTRFNAILGALFVVIAVVGPLRDGLFGVILVLNTAIGIVQELRAKAALDRLAMLNAPTARAVRSGSVTEIAAEDVVADDLIELRPGDQVVADGEVVAADGMELDESLLSGEAEPVAKAHGDAVLSGSFVVAGAGRYRAVRVGEAAYAQRLQQEARRFSLVRSELQQGTNRLLQLVTWVMVPAAGLLLWSQLRRPHEALDDALRGSVAGVGSMVPEGLVLLTTLAFAVGALRLARRRVLVQELPAIEGLARVDVVCVDKTGTLTEPGMRVVAVDRLTGEDPGAALGALAAADPSPNPSLRAVAAACPEPPGWTPAHRVPFSSARKWSAVTFAERGTWVLGAPDILLERVESAPGGPGAGPVDAAAAASRVRGHGDRGRRVLLLARTGAPVTATGPAPPVEPVAVVALEEQVRPDAPDTVRYLLAQGIALKVISGDDPHTVGTIAGRVGVPQAGSPVDARSLPDDEAGLADALEGATVFGRVTPHQKRAMVAALQARGHVVAMTGDGVNDVPALKDADLGIAMGSGSAASRAVGRVVLLDDSFASFPAVLAEGRRVIANIERVANLFVTKTVYAALLAVAVGVAQLPFPFYPRHLTVVSSLTIGIPGFFLALAHSAARARSGFLPRVLRFAGPAGFAAATATFTSYAVTRAATGTSLEEARTMATVALFLVALVVLTRVARPLDAARVALIAAMAGCFCLVLALPFARTFLGFAIPSLALLGVTVGVAAACSALMVAGLRWTGAATGAAGDDGRRRGRR